MTRGRSPVRGRSHVVEKREVDQLARDAIEMACRKWNDKIKFEQVLVEGESMKWLANGNIEAALRIDSARTDLDFQEFVAFMLAELGSEVSIRLDDGKPVLVAVNQAILDTIPQYRFRWRARWARLIEKAQSVVFNVGIVMILSMLVILPVILAPESSAALLAWIVNNIFHGFGRFFSAITSTAECVPPK
jgi:hypothetical protein